MAHDYVLYVILSHRISFHGTRNAMSRKTCQLRLSRNSTKFDVLAIFCETIPTVKSVSSFEIQRINSGFLTEITILPFFQKLEFLRSYRTALTIERERDQGCTEHSGCECW